MDSYMMELMQTFQDEVEELFDAIDSNLLILEKDPSSTAVINSIFRPVHTLKGSAGMMNLDATNMLAHALEDRLDQIRNGKIKCDSQQINLFFEATDCLKALSHAEISNSPLPKNYSGLLKNLKESPAGKTGQSCEATALTMPRNIEETARKGMEEGRSVLVIKVPFDSDCLMKSSSAFLVVSNLEEIGDVAWVEPSPEDPAIEEVDFFTLILFDPRENIDTVLELTEIPMMTEIGIVIQESRGKQENRPIGPAVDVNEAPTERPMSEKPERSEEENFFVRIPIHNIDEMMSLVEEMFVGKSHFINLIDKISRSNPYHPVIKKLNLLSRNMDKLTLLLEKKVISIRKVSLNKELARFNRLARDLSRKHNTDVKLNIEETDIEIDLEMWKKLAVAIEIVLDNIVADIIQRLSSGKESLNIKILSQYRDSDIIITLICDDEKFSFKGIDHVNNILNSISGRLNVYHNNQNRGLCSFQVPIDSSRVEVIYFKKGDNIFAVPVACIEKILKLKSRQVKTVNRQKVICYADRVVTLMEVGLKGDMMESDPVDGDETGRMSVIISDSDRYAAILVDGVLGEDKVLVKKLDDLFFDTDYVIGATVMGDGRVVLVINPLSFFKSNAGILETV